MAEENNTTTTPSPAPSRVPARRGASSDLLQAYMREVTRIPLLTPQEERDLAIAYQEEGDVDAAQRLVTSNLRLVAKIAFRYQRFYHNVLDLIQEGNIGLMQAVRKFDPYRGVRLSSYARYWIQAYIMYFLLANHRLVKVGTTQAQRKLFYNLTKETERLRAAGYNPTPRLLARNLDVEEHEVREMASRLRASDASLDAPIGGEEGRTLGQSLAAPEAISPEDEVADARALAKYSNAMHEFAEHLTNERDRTIWYDRMISPDPLTLQQIGDRFGFSRERARQLEARIKKRLKVYLEERFGTDIEVTWPAS